MGCLNDVASGLSRHSTDIPVDREILSSSVYVKTRGMSPTPLVRRRGERRRGLVEAIRLRIAHLVERSRTSHGYSQTGRERLASRASTNRLA